MNILITGVGSGLGKYLHQVLGGVGIDRATPPAHVAFLQQQYFDVIIHCAFNTAKEIPSERLSSYLEDTVFLTQSILKIPHNKFIYFSSVDVYPKTGLSAETDSIDLSALHSFYGAMKLVCEALISGHSRNALLLRCATLLGPYLRKNTILKILKDETPVLTVSPGSSFNCILMSDLLKFIRHSIKNDLAGIYNVASTNNISVASLALLSGKDVQYGNHDYTPGSIDTKKIVQCFPLFNKTSDEVITQFGTTDFFA